MPGPPGPPACPSWCGERQQFLLEEQPTPSAAAPSASIASVAFIFIRFFLFLLFVISRRQYDGMVKVTVKMFLQLS
jgi:hypothetical protein